MQRPPPQQDAQPALHQAIHSHIGTLLDARRTDVVARVVAQCHATMLQLPTARPKATAPSGGIGLRFTHPCMCVDGSVSVVAHILTLCCLRANSTPRCCAS